MKCSNCGRDYVNITDQKFCSFCGELLETKVDNSEKSHSNEIHSALVYSDLPKVKSYCPWEDLENVGFVRALLQTLKQSLFAPSEFFSRLPKKNGLLNPLLYGLILETFGSMTSFTWSIALGNTLISTLALSSDSIILIGLLIPLIVFIGIIVWVAILHVSLLIINAAKHDFEGTLRAVCYSTGPEIFSTVPILGGIIQFFWKLYLTIVGLREIHEITTGKAIAGIVLPFFVCGAIPLIAVLTISLLFI